jgi:hypothetical protein
MAEETREPDVRMGADDLYREETFTDRRVGSLQRLTPVKLDGSRDESRDDVFVGQTQILTPAGALPLNFEIPASSLNDAVTGFGDSAKTALAEAMERLEELRRESASSIIVPGSGTGGGGTQLR